MVGYLPGLSGVVTRCTSKLRNNLQPVSRRMAMLSPLIKFMPSGWSGCMPDEVLQKILDILRKFATIPT
jgi:hypothetical protein